MTESSCGKPAAATAPANVDPGDLVGIAGGVADGGGCDGATVGDFSEGRADEDTVAMTDGDCGGNVDTGEVLGTGAGLHANPRANVAPKIDSQRFAKAAKGRR